MLRILLLLALVIFLAALVGLKPAYAQQPQPEIILGFATEPVVGEESAIVAYLLDPAGNPIQGELVTFSVDAEFMNTIGRLDIGRMYTDENGLALLVHTPKLSGEKSVKASFAGNEIFAPAQSIRSIEVAAGDETYEQEAIFRIPGVNIGIVVVVLIAIWSTYLSVVGLFWLISRAGSGEGPEAEIGYD